MLREDSKKDNIVKDITNKVYVYDEKVIQLCSALLIKLETGFFRQYCKTNFFKSCRHLLLYEFHGIRTAFSA